MAYGKQQTTDSRQQTAGLTVGSSVFEGWVKYTFPV
jgi:hypothetical protein